MSEKPDIRSFFKRDESSQKGDDNTLSSKQGGGDSEKMLQKAAEQVAKRKSQQTNYDKTKRQRVLKESWSKIQDTRYKKLYLRSAFNYNISKH